MKLFKFRQFFDAKYIPHERRRVQILTCLFVWSIFLCFVYQNFVVGSVRVAGTSMEPTLADGEKKIYWKWDYIWRDPRRGEVVVFRDPRDGVLSVKRVLGLAGDHIEIRDAGVWIGGERLTEKYLDPRAMTFGVEGKKSVYDVGPSRFFVLGDHRGASRDSREYGPIQKSRILGRVPVEE